GTLRGLQLGLQSVDLGEQVAALHQPGHAGDTARTVDPRVQVEVGQWWCAVVHRYPQVSQVAPLLGPRLPATWENGQSRTLARSGVVRHDRLDAESPLLEQRHH